MSAAYVYEVYDVQGRLIYVGSTRDVVSRMRKHVTDSWWISQATKVKASVFPSIRVAQAEERRRIHDLHPRWNLHMLPARWTWTQQQYHDYLTARTHRPPMFNPFHKHYERLAAEYRYRFGCELLVPSDLIPGPEPGTAA